MARSPIPRPVAFEPFGSLAVVKLDTDSLKENDAIAALRNSGFDEDVSYSTLGLRAATTIRISNMVITHPRSPRHGSMLSTT